MSAAYARLLAAARPLGEEELLVLVECAERLAKGQQEYGPLDLLHDARDFARERHEEILDGAIYEACDTVRARLVATAPTDPCPPPSGVELDDGTRVLGVADLPDAAPTLPDQE